MSGAPQSPAAFGDSPAPRTMRGLPLSRVMRLARKELREILRDRRTIVTLVLMPVLVYPLLSIAFQRFLVSSLHPPAEAISRIGVESQEQGEMVSQALARGDAILAQRAQQGRQRPDDKSPARGGSNPDEKTPSAEANADDRLRAGYFKLDDLESAVASGTIDLGIRIIPRDREPISAEEMVPVVCELIYRDGDTHGMRLLREVERRIAVVNEFHMQRRLAQLGDSGAVPAFVQRKVLAPTGSSSSSLKTLVPLILVLMTITGAVYPAIDLTAGERERGTLEMLVAAPVSRLELMLGKYVAVLTVALLTATANLTAMSVTILSMGLSRLVLGESGLTLIVVAEVFGLMVLFASFFSAVLLAVTSFARSFKEAQAYLIPLMMVSIAPGLLSLTPDLKLNGLLAITPLVNIVLLARDLFAGAPIDPILAAVTIFSTLLFAIAALGLAARIFGTDAILYGSQGNWSDVWRGPAQPRAEASVSGAMLCLAILFPTLFFVNNALRGVSETSISFALMLSGGAQLLLFALIPLAAAWLARVNLRSGFRLNGAPVLSFLGAAVLGMSLWPLAFQVLILSRDLGLVTIAPERYKEVQDMIVSVKTVSPVWFVLAFGFLPAISEELFFRGYLFGALRARKSAWATILASSVIFGLFHLIATDSLAVERLLPTTGIGLALGWLRSRTKSVFPGMILHAFHNSLLLLVAYYHQELAALGFGQMEQEYLPWTWLASGGFAAAVAVLLIVFATRQTSEVPMGGSKS